MSDDRKVSVEIEARTQGLMTGLSQATSAIKEHTEKMGGMFSELGERMTGATGKLSGFTDGFAAMGPALGILAGAAVAVKGIEVAFDQIKESIQATIDRAEEFQKVAYKVGGSFDNLNAADAAIKMTGGSLDQLGNLSTQAARAMKANEKAINENGIATRDANGNYLQFSDYLKNVVEQADKMATPMDRNKLLITALGRSGADAGPQLKELVEHMEEGRKVAEKYGNVIGGDDVKAMQEYKAAQGEVSYAVEVMQSQIGRQLIPILTKALQIVGEYLPAAMDLLKATIVGIIDATASMAKGWNALDEYGAALSKTVGTGVVAAFEAVNLAMSGHFEAAKNTMNKGLNEVAGAWHNATQKVSEFNTAADKVEADMIAKMSGADGGGLGPGGKKKFKAPGGGDKDEVAELRQHPKEMEDARADDDQMSKTEVAAYWKNILDTERLSAKERLEVFHEYVAARRSAEKEQATAAKAAAKQTAEVAKLQDEEELSHAQAGFAQKRAMLDAEVAAHKITAAQRLQIEKQMLDQEYSLELAAMQKKLALDAQDPVKRQQALNQIQKLDDKYRLDKLKLDTQLTKKEETLWDQMYKKIQASAQQNLDALIHKTESFGQASKNIAMSIADTYLQMGEEMLLNWVKNMAAAKVASIDTATTQVTANASVGGSAAAASAAQDGPYGWMIAIGAGLAVMAGINAMMPSASAAGGYDIPAGVNPVVQAHAEEMILPSGLANSIRGMVKGGGSTGGGHTINNIYALDGMSVERVLRNNANGLSRGIRNASRNGFLRR